MWEKYDIIFSFYYNFLTIMNIHTLLGGLTIKQATVGRTIAGPLQ